MPNSDSNWNRRSSRSGFWKSGSGWSGSPGTASAARPSATYSCSFSILSQVSAAKRLQRRANGSRSPQPQKTNRPSRQTSRKPRLDAKHPGRQKLPSHLARVEQEVPCTGGQCQCTQCGARTQVIGYQETEVLDVRPAEYFV